MDTEKQCAKCGKKKPLSAFRLLSIDGTRQNICRRCRPALPPPQWRVQKGGQA